MCAGRNPSGVELRESYTAHPGIPGVWPEFSSARYPRAARWWVKTGKFEIDSLNLARRDKLPAIGNDHPGSSSPPGQACAGIPEWRECADRGLVRHVSTEGTG